jgi:hypothetical protein
MKKKKKLLLKEKKDMIKLIMMKLKKNTIFSAECKNSTAINHLNPNLMYPASLTLINNLLEEDL